MRERETEGRKRLRNNKHDIMILYPVLEQTYSDIDSDGKAICRSQRRWISRAAPQPTAN